MTRILVTGSRDWTDRELLERSLDDLVEMLVHQALRNDTGFTLSKLVIVHGACPCRACSRCPCNCPRESMTIGADAMADQWATKNAYAVERHPADWDRLGKRAGPVRNYGMVELGAHALAGFPLSWPSGTEDCYTKAIRAGIPMLVVPGKVPT